MAVAGARVLVSLVFIVVGAQEALAFPLTAAYFAKLGFPVPYAMTGLAVAIQLVAGLLLLLGWHARPAAWLLAAFVLVATFAGHRFWEFDPAFSTNQFHHFFKNLALLGALIHFGSLGPGPLALGKR